MSVLHQLPPTIPSLADILRRGTLSPETPAVHNAHRPANLNRMHIHIDLSSMAESQYLSPGAHVQTDAMQVDSAVTTTGCSSSRPPTAAVAYSAADLTPYSAVSSFNYPATADPTLLTPVSNAGSPPTQQRLPKPMHSYGPSSSVAAQQPTPPTSSRLFTSYDVNHSSQSSSPLTGHPPSAEGFDVNYLNGSPSEEMPPQVTPYYGHYGVSEPPDVDPSHFQSTCGYDQFVSMDPDSTHFYPRTQAGPISAASLYSLTASAVAPILNHPHPSHFRPDEGASSRIEDLVHVPQQGGGGQPPLYTQSSSANASPRRRKQPGAKRPSRKPAGRRPGSEPAQASPGGTGEGDDEAGEAELTLDDKASEEDRFLLKCRWEMRQERGKGMWDLIIEKYKVQFGVDISKAALQMKMSRVVRKYAKWPETEEEILRKVYLEDEEKRFARYATRMKELGGGKVWNWSAADVEAKLIKLGYEDAKMDDESKRRQRRRNATSRRRSAAASAARHPDPNALLWHNMGGGGGGGGGVATHPQYPLPPLPASGGGGGRSAYDLMGDSVSTAGLPQYTSDQENDILDQLERKYGGDDDALSLSDVKGDASEYGGMAVVDDGDAHGLSRQQQQQQQQQQHAGDGGGGAAGINHVHSERVARQACEQLIHRARFDSPYTPVP